MKAQQVKNAVIVPVGSKGGFYPKLLPAGGSADAVRALVPTATLEVLPGVGHDTVRDAPEVLARVVGSIQ